MIFVSYLSCNLFSALSLADNSRYRQQVLRLAMYINVGIRRRIIIFLQCLDTSPEPSNGHCFDRETCETPQKTFQLAAVVKDVMQNVHCLESLKTISKG